MMRTAILTGLVALVSSALPIFTVVAGAPAGHANPFLAPSTLPFQAIPFDKIKDSDFQPAFEQAMQSELLEIDAIANNPRPASFANTLVALEKSGQMLTRVNRAFNALSSANTNPVLQKVQESVAPKLAAHRDAIFLNDKLFQRVAQVYKQREALRLDAESRRLVEYYYQEFVHQGANLESADKATLKDLNREEATLTAQFVNRLLEGTKAGGLVLSKQASLDGLSEAEIQAAAQAAKARGLKGKWVLPLQNTTQQPALQSLTNRNVRQRLFMASWTRTQRGDKNDTRSIIAKLAGIRASKAKLLGFANYAAWNLTDQMAKNPRTVEQFVAKLVPPTVTRARREAQDIQAMIDAGKGGFKLQPWDWNFYAEKVRKAKFDLDESQVKPYFELQRVLRDGVFYAAHKLYGLSFKQRTDLPVYHQDMQVYEVIDHDGSSIGLFYTDYFKRDNKSGGAWMDNLVDQSKLLGTKPVIYNVTNFTKPAPGQPALLSYDDVTTLFHEFGHALHGFFADQQYPSLSGTSTARDFVEFPSQFNEHWAMDPDVFAHYAVHYKTGQPMPKALVEKIKKSSKFNQGYAFTELLAAADLDMAWHTLPTGGAERQPQYA